MSSTEIVVALIGLLTASISAYLIYQRGSRADKAVNDNVAVAQVYEGYGGLLQRIQADNAELRLLRIQDSTECKRQIAELREEYDKDRAEFRVQIEELEGRVSKLIEKLGGQ